MAWLVACNGTPAGPCDDPAADACHVEQVRALAASSPRDALAEARRIADPQTRDAALLELVRLTGMNACPDVTNATARGTCDDLRGRRHLWGAGNPVDPEVEDKQAEDAARRGDLDEARAECAAVVDRSSRDECAFRVAEAAASTPVGERVVLCADAGQFADHCQEHMRREGIRQAVATARGGGFVAVVAELAAVQPVVSVRGGGDPGRDDAFWTDALSQVFLALDPAALGTVRAVEAALPAGDPLRAVVETSRAYAWAAGTTPDVADLPALLVAWRAAVPEATAPALAPDAPLPWSTRRPAAPWGNRPWALDPAGGCRLQGDDRVAVALLWALMAGDTARFVPVAASALDADPPAVRAYAVTALLEHVFDKGAELGPATAPLLDRLDRLAADADPVLASVGSEAAAALRSGKPPRRTDGGRKLCRR